MDMKNTPRALFFSLSFILLLGAILRIYNLDKESLWFDEVGSINLSMRSPIEVFTKFHNSFFYFWLLKYWIKCFGLSESALRYLSAILGICSIFVIYKIARILFNQKIGLISAFLLSISPVHIFYSQEIRNYSLFLLLSLCSMLIFIKLIKKNQLKQYLLIILVNILLLFTFSFGILIILIQNIFFFIIYKHEKKRRWIISQLILSSLFLLWAIPIFFELINGPWIKPSTSWIKKPGLNTLIETFKTFCYGAENYGGNELHINPKFLLIPRYLIYVFGILFIFGLSLLKNPPYKDNLKLIILWLSSIIIPFLVSIVFLPVYVTRYVIYALPPFLIIIAAGINKLKFKKIVIFTVLFLTIHSLIYYYTKELKINWKDAISYINANIKKDDIIAIALAKQARLLGYYGKNGLKYSKTNRLDIDKKMGVQLILGGFEYNEGPNKILGINNVEQLKQLMKFQDIRKDSYIWIIISRWAVYENTADGIKEYITTSCQTIEHKQFNGVNIYKCVVPL